MQSHNWLVHRIVLDHLSKVIPRYARGRLIDIGCSTKPYEFLTKPVVAEHVGIDHSGSLHDLKYVNIIADAYNTT
jgi:hypothetical protein